MADNPDEPSQPDEPSDANADDATSGSDESGHDASESAPAADDRDDADERRGDAEQRDATTDEHQPDAEHTDAAGESPETLGDESLPGPDEDHVPDELPSLDGAEAPDGTEDFETLDEASLDGSDVTDSENADEPTGGLERVDDGHDPAPDGPADDSDESVGLPGPSMDTQPPEEPSRPTEDEHVADAPSVDEPVTGDPESSGTAGPGPSDPAADEHPPPPPDAAPADGADAGAVPPDADADRFDEHPPAPEPPEEYSPEHEPPRAPEHGSPEEHPPGPEPIGPNDAETGAPMAEDVAAEGPSFMDAPPDDEEMPLTEHIEEMVLRLSAVAVSAAAVAIAFYALGVDAWIPRLWYHIHPGAVDPCVGSPNTPFTQCAPPHIYSPVEYFLTKLKLSGIVGLVVALPVGVYQTYLFMRPGLYPKERRYYLASVPLSLVLALMGVAFATFVILPLLFDYFLTYSADTVSIAFQLKDTMNLMLALMGWLAVIFQIPLLMMLAVLMGVTSRAWMASNRLYFWGGFGGLAFLFGAVDPTGVAPILLAITMIVLFEVTLLMLRWVGR